MNPSMEINERLNIIKKNIWDQIKDATPTGKTYQENIFEYLICNYETRDFLRAHIIPGHYVMLDNYVEKCNNWIILIDNTLKNNEIKMR